jgi:Flp pilus assembly protein TadG
MMIFGIIDISRAMYSYHYVAIAARQATRYASVRGATWASTLCLLSAQFQCAATSSSVTTFVKSVTPLGFNASNLTVTTTWPGTTPTGADCSTANVNNSVGCVVSVKVAYSYNFILPFLPKNAMVLSSTSKVMIVQ